MDQVTESKEGTVIIELELGVGLIKAKKTRRHGGIFVCHENAEKLDVPTIGRSLTSFRREDTVSRPFPVITVFPLFVTDVVRLDGYVMSGHFNERAPLWNRL